MAEGKIERGLAGPACLVVGPNRERPGQKQRDGVSRPRTTDPLQQGADKTSLRLLLVRPNAVKNGRREGGPIAVRLSAAWRSWKALR